MKSIKVLMVVGLMMVAGSAFAQSESADGIINAEVVDACTLTGFTLDLGQYNANTGSTPGSTTFTVQCTKGTAPVLTFGNGGAADTTNSRRQMWSGSTSSLLGYVLEVEGLTIPLDDAAPGTVTLADDGSEQTLDVTGSIPASQFSAAAAADYSDTVVITVAF